MSFSTNKRTYSPDLLDRVLEQYPRASTMTDADTDPKRLFKSIDDKTGLVYLIAAPASWSYRYDSNGRTTRIRPFPIKQGHIDELIKAGGGTPPVPEVDWGV